MEAASNGAADSNGASHNLVAPAPRDAQAITKLLASMGVEQYEPRVVNMLLEFTHRYVVQVLKEANIYSEHAGKTELDVADVKLAIQSRVDTSFTQPPPREFLVDLARNKNVGPLPKIDFRPGVRLPPEQHCMTNTNYQMPPSDSGFAPSGSGDKVAHQPSRMPAQPLQTGPLGQPRVQFGFGGQ
mmetsp:Transcript_2846/g.6975  ORF Transcript_2846/g.6975 Transcript_2846/m.6975 type:complete len:185 (-) Transcript_2846:303-857(-)